METRSVEAWIYSTLAADTALHALVADRIYNSVALDANPFPCVVYEWQGGHDVKAVGAKRIMLDALYVVKAIVKSAKFADAEGIADRIDTLLNGTSGTTSDGTVLGCTREQPFELAEVDGETHYRHLGGIYRVWAS